MTGVVDFVRAGVDDRRGVSGIVGPRLSVGVRVGVRVRIGVPGQAVWISVRSPDHRVWKVPSLSIRLYVWAPKKSR